MKSLRNPNRKPTHPGAVLREDVLPDSGWTQAEFAIRLSRTLGGTPESWLRMQEAVDLWEAEAKFKLNPALAPRALAAA